MNQNDSLKKLAALLADFAGHYDQIVEGIEDRIDSFENTTTQPDYFENKFANEDSEIAREVKRRFEQCMIQNQVDLEKSNTESFELAENTGCEKLIEEGPIRSFDSPENIIKITDLELETESNKIDLIPRTGYHLAVLEDELNYFFSKIKINMTGYSDDFINGDKLTFAKSKGAVIFIKSFHPNLIQSENKYYNPGLRPYVEGNLVASNTLNRSIPEINKDLVSQVQSTTSGISEINSEDESTRFRKNRFNEKFRDICFKLKSWSKKNIKRNKTRKGDRSNATRKSSRFKLSSLNAPGKPRKRNRSVRSNATNKKARFKIDLIGHLCHLGLSYRN